MTTTRTHNHERGAFVLIVAICLPVVLGLLGLVVDVGTVYALKRDMQTGADAAAIAAMQEIRSGNETSYGSAAYEDAYLNGFEPGLKTEIEVNRPPKRGPRSGDPGFVEVIIRKEQPPVFMASLRGNAPTVVEARAVAGVRPNGACVYALNSNESNSLRATGTANMNLGDCGILVNSSNSAAGVTTGSASVMAGSIGIVGDYSGPGFNPTPETGIEHFPDPLADLPVPSFSQHCDYNNTVVKKAVTLNPGVYCGGITVQASGDVVMNPGMYIMMGGGFQTNGGRIVGDAVTIYLTEKQGKPYAPADFGGNTTTILSAPLSGPYKGVLFFQDRSITDNKPNRFRGTSDTHFKGVLYFSTTQLIFTGNAHSSSRSTLIVADKVELDGTAQLASLGTDYMPRGMSQARMVE